MNKKLILITNDDGILAPGLKALVNIAKKHGEVVVVAPNSPQSGMGHAITINHPLRLHKIEAFEGIEAYECTGTPVDCVKLAKNVLLNSKGANPKIHVWVFSLKRDDNSSDALTKMQNLRSSLMKSDLNKLSVHDKEEADVVELTDYSKLTPYSKSMLQDTNKGSVSQIYKENDQYKLMVVLEKDFVDIKKVAAIKDSLKMQKAERKYNFFVKNLHSKADIVIK